MDGWMEPSRQEIHISKSMHSQHLQSLMLWSSSVTTRVHKSVYHQDMMRLDCSAALVAYTIVNETIEMLFLQPVDSII
jgi:hypothetical protein